MREIILLSIFIIIYINIDWEDVRFFNNRGSNLIHSKISETERLSRHNAFIEKKKDMETDIIETIIFEDRE